MTLIEIGEKLKIARKEMKATQAYIAQNINVSVRTYARYERGESEIPSEILLYFMSVGYSANWLLNGIEPMRLPDFYLEDIDSAVEDGEYSVDDTIIITPELARRQAVDLAECREQVKALKKTVKIFAADAVKAEKG